MFKALKVFFTALAITLDPRTKWGLWSLLSWGSSIAMFLTLGFWMTMGILTITNLVFMLPPVREAILPSLMKASMERAERLMEVL